MQRMAFVTDFDGTLTFKDFYHIVIDKYLGEKGRSLYTEWKKTRKINVEFLNLIFGSLNLTQDELTREILDIPFDSTAVPFMEWLSHSGWDFYIVSAGTSYYIEILLDHLGIRSCQLISMKGVYENGGIRIIPDPNSPFYSEVFGLDKGKVLGALKDKYERVVFAGDSEPDLSAALRADHVFARSELAQLMDKAQAAYVPYESYSDIQSYFVEKGWLK